MILRGSKLNQDKIISSQPRKKQKVSPSESQAIHGQDISTRIDSKLIRTILRRIKQKAGVCTVTHRYEDDIGDVLKLKWNNAISFGTKISFKRRLLSSLHSDECYIIDAFIPFDSNEIDEDIINIIYQLESTNITFKICQCIYYHFHQLRCVESVFYHYIQIKK